MAGSEVLTQAAAWVHEMLQPRGPLQLVDGAGQVWRAARGQRPGDFAVWREPPAPQEERPKLAVRVAGASPPKTAPAFARPASGCARGLQYSLLRVIGGGSYGQVWLAQEPQGRLVAIKRAVRERRALEHEAAVLHGLRHGCIADCLDFFRDAAGVAHMVQTLACGTLLNLLAAPVERRRTLHALGAMRLGLLAVHAAGYAHLDLSPCNVLVYADGSVRLADFGTAQREGEAIRALYIGKRKYRAPELLVGALRVDRRMDLWSLGVIGLELAVRRDSVLLGRTTLQQLLLVLELLGPPPPAQVQTWLEGAPAPALALHWPPTLAGLAPHVLDEAAYRLSVGLLSYDAGARAEALRAWPQLMRQLRAPPAAPASRRRTADCGARKPRRSA